MSQYQHSAQRGASSSGQHQQSQSVRGSTGGQTLAEPVQTDSHQPPAHSSGRLFPTGSYLSAGVRESVIACLNHTLADATILQTHARFAHWNVKGMSFYGLHELFEDLADDLADHIDLIAERITALGGQAMGTAGMAVAGCRLPQMRTDVVTGEEFVDVLAERIAVFDANLYGDIQTATGCDDLDTADLLNEVSRDVSKYRWFLEAHLQTEPVGVVGAQPAQATGEPQPTPQQPAEHYAGGHSQYQAAPATQSPPASSGQSSTLPRGQPTGQPTMQHPAQPPTQQPTQSIAPEQVIGEEAGQPMVADLQ